MSGRQYDVIFIGGGSAARAGAAYLRRRGIVALLVEKDDHIGGTCSKCGCGVQHFYYEQAQYLDKWRWFSGKMWYPPFGDKVSIQEIARIFRQGRKKAYEAIRHEVKDIPFVLLKEDVKIVDRNTVIVDGEEFKTKNIVITTGARPLIPDVDGVNLKRVLTYQDMVNMNFEPENVVVIGCGKIGTGYASFFRSCGCEVTIVDKIPIFKFLDEAIRSFVIENMKRRYIRIFENTSLKKLAGEFEVEGVVVERDGKEQFLKADTVLLSIGVIPNSEVGKEAGIKVGAGNEILVDQKMRTNIDGIYAAGDVTGPPNEMWKARKEGIIAASNIVGNDVKMPVRHEAEFMFTTFEVCWVGLTEKEARQKYDDVIILRYPHGKLDEVPGPDAEGSMTFAWLYPAMAGLQKAVVDGNTRKFLGFHTAGYGSKDAFQYLAALLDKGITLDEMSELNELFHNPTRFIQESRKFWQPK